MPGVQFVKRKELNKTQRCVQVGQAAHKIVGEKREQAEADRRRQQEAAQKVADKLGTLVCLQTMSDVDTLAQGESHFSQLSAPGARYKEAWDKLKHMHAQLDGGAAFTSEHNALFNSVKATMDPEKCKLDATNLSAEQLAALQTKLGGKTTPQCRYCSNVDICCKKGFLKLMLSDPNMPPHLNSHLLPRVPAQPPPAAAQPVLQQGGSQTAALAPAPPASVRRPVASSALPLLSDDTSDYIPMRQPHAHSNQSIGSRPPAQQHVRQDPAPVPSSPAPRRQRRAAAAAALAKGGYSLMHNGSPLCSQSQE